MILRVNADPIYLGEIALDRMTRLDQLTVVRNHVRKCFAAHREDVSGEAVSQVEVEVGWLSGDVDTLVFDKMVGFPIEPPGVDWYAEWRSETLSPEKP